MTDHAARERAALWAALALILCWGANFSVQKAVFAALTPGGFLFVRYLIMPIAAVLLLFAHFGTRWPRLARRELWQLFKLGVTGHLLHVGLVTYGIHWSTAFSSSLILAIGPVFTLLILRWHGSEHLTRGQVAGVALAVCGVLVFLSDKLIGAQWQAGGGDLTLLVAAAFFSLYTVNAKPLIERHGGVIVMAYGTLLGSLPVLAVSAAQGLRVDWAAVSWPIWLGTLYAVLVAAFLGWIVWGWINAVRGVARTAPLMYLMPPVAALVAWIVSGERYGATKLLGAAITLGGVALAQFAAGSRADAARDSVPPIE